MYFLRPKRTDCRKHFKELRELQGGGCAVCGQDYDLECDHVIPISIDPFSRNTIDNLQLLCKACHNLKTTEQAWTEPYNPLQSTVNDHVWQELVLSPRIPQLICRYNSIDKRVPLQICDAIRCRYNLLAHLSPCVFSIWDEIVEITQPTLFKRK